MFHPSASLRLVALSACLLGASPVRGAFERPLFLSPDAPAGLPEPALFADAQRPCGGLAWDRPFGLRELMGHRGAWALPLRRSVVLGAGLALRGPQRHRERGAWAGVGWRRAGLASSVSLLYRAWAGTGRAGRAAWSPVLSATIARHTWALSGQWQAATAEAPARLHLQVRRCVEGDCLGLDLRRVGRARPVPVLHLETGGRLRLSGEVVGLMRRLRVGAALSGPIDVGIGTRSHSVLGPSWAAWTGRACR
jgi:hypothetical protein